jgi:hypothetical protein
MYVRAHVLASAVESLTSKDTQAIELIMLIADYVPYMTIARC